MEKKNGRPNKYLTVTMFEDFKKEYCQLCKNVDRIGARQIVIIALSVSSFVAILTKLLIT